MAKSEQSKGEEEKVRRWVEDAARRRATAPKRLLSRADLRALAEARLEEASCFMMRAFNLTCDPASPYIFDPKVRDRAERLLRDLISLHRDSKFQAQVGSAIQGNAEFQRFMAKAIQAPVG